MHLQQSDLSVLPAHRRSFLPNLFVLGAQKAGTTWLARCLGAQPYAFVPAAKEIHYFENEEIWVRGQDYYRSQFAGAEAARWIIDATPNYLCDPKVPERVHELCPDARFIVSLRNPVLRTISGIRHQIASGRYPANASVNSVLRELLNGGEDPYRIIEKSRYLPALRRWLHLFPRERFCFLVFETDVVSDNGTAALGYMADFLDESPIVAPPVSIRYRNSTPRSRLALLISRNILKSSQLNPIINLFGRNVRNSEATPQLRQQLARLFHDEYDALSELTRRNVSHWKAANGMPLASADSERTGRQLRHAR